MNIDPNAPKDKPETAQMVVIHKALRREFTLMPTLVAAVADGDLSRAATIAEHAQLSMRFLHEHHNSEDRLIWPILQERMPLEERLIELMKRQHQTVDDLIALITPKLVAWSKTADTRTRELIAGWLTELGIALDEHLVREETDALPLIHENLSVAEWNASEDEALKNGPRRLSAKLLLAGMVLEDATPAEYGWFLSVMPSPARILWRIYGKASYRKYTQSIRRGRSTHVQS